ncbi:hypothetical protein [Tenacibaculum finnmarkense]|uniref:hypothetical protein n=1 Tax=Tenacibaculum finnmarkense TaxID=2781243 RepID=UPI001EFB2E56|nr:hypothetical protein [Tenacibaculum finnmarkense]MCG8208471.1 hypothetical protein [Tenacibaculum finnmarkense genomovar finnmarkense]MCG8724418.1 hypothetical protein [Tenacibaculum finnmarkense]MCG8742736.1 hypothetical protein [Tenacibaculum finnmarkense]MCG8766145.1 hypothetical protein [Tenacibaculum finnmarkense]MCG8779107.1 hypothetical protein [Tenacibaculum finnmarkense]
MSVNIHLSFEIQNIPENKKEIVYSKAITFFKNKNLFDELMIEWEGKNKNCLVAHEIEPIIFRHVEKNITLLKDEWQNVFKKTLTECNIFLSYGLAD